MEIHITDTAGGVPPDTIDRILNPVVTTWPPVQGTGSGLALSSNVNCQHEDEIMAESGPGVFSDLNAVLPAGSPSEAGDDGITDALDNGRGHIT